MIKQNGMETLEAAVRGAVTALPKWLPCPEGDCEASVPAEAIEISVRLDDRRLTVTTVQEIGSHPHEGCEGADILGAEVIAEGGADYELADGSRASVSATPPS